MSASSIARWNSIPLTRDSKSSSNKRPRSHDGYEQEDIDGGDHPRDANDDDSSEDNVSIVSRSPSPQLEGGADVKDITLYDEHIRGVAREVITIETKIRSSNKGFAMLAKMGWVEGTPLGLSGEGRIDPIPFTVKQDSQGLGKSSQDFRMIETTVAQRRNLDSERMQFETEEQRLEREAAVAHKEAVRSEISAVLRPFYCELCDKQFRNVAQYDEHTNSYAHHHRVRLKDMNANHPMKVGGQVEIERRKEKERRREEKELRKMAKAAGIKMPTPTPMAAAVPLVQPPTGGTSGGFKKSGWASVSSSTVAPCASSSSSGSGWAAVSSPAVPNAPRTSPGSASGGSGSGWRTVTSSNNANPPLPPPDTPSYAPPPPTGTPPPSGLPPSSSTTGIAGPGFVSGGWSTLTQSSNTLSSRRPPSPASPATCAPPGAPPPALPPPPPPIASASPLAAASRTTLDTAGIQRGGWARVPTHPAPPSAPAPANGRPLNNHHHHHTTTHTGGGSGGSNWRSFQRSRGRR